MDTSGIVAGARSQALGDLLRRSAARQPDKTALVWRERRESFAELDAAVNRVAHSLADRGVAQGDRVAIYSHNCREFVLAYFALARLGARDMRLADLGIVDPGALRQAADRYLAAANSGAGLTLYLTIETELWLRSRPDLRVV